MSTNRQSLRGDLQKLGLAGGDIVMVHAGVRKIGPVTGGVNVIVQALLDAIGSDGTLVAYVDWEAGVDDWKSPHVPVFDRRIARAARDHGILHEVIRTWPGARRSAHPDAGVAAVGARAEWICEPHPFYYGYGEGTPFERVIEGGGKVLMLGAPLDTITLLHHSEHVACLPQKRVLRYQRLMPGANGPEWMDFEEFDTGRAVTPQLECEGEYFGAIAEEFLRSGKGSVGRVGEARSYLFDAGPLDRFAVAWMEAKTAGR